VAFTYQRRKQEVAEDRANQSGGGFEGFIKDEYRQYGPKNGDNAIRIFPRDASEGAEHYGEDVWVHFNVGPERATVICPFKMAQEPCPVCEELAKAQRVGDKESIDALKPSRRVVVWLLDRKNEEHGPLVWGMPWSVDRDINKACRDRETGVFYFPEDPQEGYDIYFDRSGTPPFVDYTTFQLSRKPNSLDPKHLDFISKNPILETLRIRDYATIKRMFEGAKAPPATGPAEVAKPAESQAAPATTAPVTAGNGHVAPSEDSRPPLRREPPPQEPQESVPPNGPAPSPAPAREPEPVAAPAAPPPSGADRAAALRARFAPKGAGA
jgi:hypothetical protein